MAYSGEWAVRSLAAAAAAAAAAVVGVAVALDLTEGPIAAAVAGELLHS